MQETKKQKTEPNASFDKKESSVKNYWIPSPLDICSIVLKYVGVCPTTVFETEVLNLSSMIWSVKHGVFMAKTEGQLCTIDTEKSMITKEITYPKPSKNEYNDGIFKYGKAEDQWVRVDLLEEESHRFSTKDPNFDIPLTYMGKQISMIYQIIHDPDPDKYSYMIRIGKHAKPKFYYIIPGDFNFGRTDLPPYELKISDGEEIGYAYAISNEYFIITIFTGIKASCWIVSFANFTKRVLIPSLAVSEVIRCLIPWHENMKIHAMLCIYDIYKSVARLQIHQIDMEHPENSKIPLQTYNLDDGDVPNTLFQVQYNSLMFESGSFPADKKVKCIQLLNNGTIKEIELPNVQSKGSVIACGTPTDILVRTGKEGELKWFYYSINPYSTDFSTTKKIGASTPKIKYNITFK
jgi:hypothetical protein